MFGLNVPTVLRETLLVELTMVRFLAHDDDGAPSPVVDDEPEEEAEAVEVEVGRQRRPCYHTERNRSIPKRCSKIKS